MSFCCRILAICLLVLALVPWGTNRDLHVLVIALDGATVPDIERFARGGLLPNISGLLSRSSVARVAASDRNDARAFWATALSVRRVAGVAPYVWTLAASRGLSSAVVGVPGTTELGDPSSLVVVPGADETVGFVGDNVGRILDPSANVATLGWPYDAAVAEASVAAAALAPGTVSPWIHVNVAGEGERTGAFRIYRLQDDWLWVSPVYRFVRNAREYSSSAPDDLVYVADDASWSWNSDRPNDYYFLHEDDLANARAQLASVLAGEGRALVVYFDPSLALVEAAYAGEPGNGATPDVLQRAYRALDTRVGSLLSAVPDSTSVVLLGRRSGTTSPVADVATTAFVAVAGSGMDWPSFGAGEVDTRDMGNLLLAALPSGSGSRVPRNEAPNEQADRAVPLTPESLRELGLLSSSSNASPARAGDTAGVVTVSSPPAR